MNFNWQDIASNQTISWDSLDLACTSGIFNQLLPIPPSGVSRAQCIRRELIQSYVQIESGPLVGVPNNELVVKNQVVAVQETYYRVLLCPSGTESFYTKTPPFSLSTIGQRYILSDTTTLYFTWDGTSFFGYQPSNYIHGLVRDGRFTGCP
jgi:hypothetical protein